MIPEIFHKLTSPDSSGLLVSILFNEETFYNSFLADLNRCRGELIIESPFATNKRLSFILPTLEKLKKKGVRVAINTKDPSEHNDYMQSEAQGSLAQLRHLGIQVIYTENHHRKLAIIDRNILWEGSLNILSHCKSKEMMRRTESPALAWQMIRFTNIDTYLN